MRTVSCFLPLALVGALACSSEATEKKVAPAAEPAPPTAVADPPADPPADPEPPTPPAAPDAGAVAAADPEPPSNPSKPAPVPEPTKPKPPTPTPTPTPKPPAAVAMDLQVLPKAWSEKQVKDYMKNEVSAGLGVKCDFCHDKSDFRKDSKHKTEAREMIRLTNDTNKRYFGGKARVSCMTCHNGKEEPAGE